MAPDELGVQFALARSNELARDGEYAAGILLVEDALWSDDTADSSRCTVRLYMRLATLYRAVGRLEDEAALLERFKVLHPDNGQLARADARLSKVYARLAAMATRDQLPLMVALRGKPRRSAVARRLDQRLRARAQSLDATSRSG